MKSFAALLLLCASVAALHAQSPTQIIRGRVVADDTGNPLPHARVVIFNDATPLPPLFADVDGRFESKPLANGRYRLSVTKARYALASVTRLDVTSPDGVDVRMRRSAAIAGRVVDLSGEPAAGVAVSIAVPPPDGTPPLPAQTTIVRTDDLGEYRFGGLTAGTYIVAVTSLSVEDTGRVTSNPSYYPGVAAVRDALRIVVQPGDQKSGIDFFSVATQITTIQTQVLTGNVNINGIAVNRLVVVTNANGYTTVRSTNVAKGTGVIRGRITRNDGVALVHATVTTVMSQAPDDAAGIGLLRSAQTDEDGRYEFLELPRGEYRITGTKSGFINASYGQKSATEPGELVTLADNQTRTRVDFALPRYSAITGQIFDDFGDPVEGVNVGIAQIRFAAGRRRLVRAGNVGPATDDLGRYRVFNVPPGQYVVSASVGQLTESGAGTDVSGFAPTYFPGTANASEAQRVTVPLAQDLAGVDFALAPTPTATISGTRLGSDGEPMAGRVTLLESERSGGIIASAVGARTWSNGRFVFPNVPPGDYVIQAGNSGKREASAEGNFVSQFVTVSGDDVPDLLLQATPGSTISGRVIFDGDGTPPSYRSLAVIPERADLDRTPDDGSIARAEVARDLTFTMSAIRGPRRLVIDRNNTSGWGLKSVMASGVDITDAPIDFGTPAQSLPDVQVILTDRLTEVRTSIVDSRGQPAQDYALLVFSENRERWYAGSRSFRRAAPDATGAVTVRGLPPGEYYLAPVAAVTSVLKDGVDAWQDPEFLDALAFRATRVTLTEGQKLTVSARLITP